jgi:hypothetical protein
MDKKKYLIKRKAGIFHNQLRVADMISGWKKYCVMEAAEPIRPNNEMLPTT